MMRGARRSHLPQHPVHMDRCQARRVAGLVLREQAGEPGSVPIPASRRRLACSGMKCAARPADVRRPISMIRSEIKNLVRCLRRDPEWLRYSRADRRYPPAPAGTAAYQDALRIYPPQEPPQDCEPDSEVKSSGKAMSPGADFRPSGQSHDSRSKGAWQFPDRAGWVQPGQMQAPAIRPYLCRLRALPVAAQSKAAPRQCAILNLGS